MIDVFLYVVVGLGVVAAVGILLHPDPVEPRITPTYHAWLWTDLRHVERDPKCGATGWRTCDVYIRRDHAEAFARPCRRCFP
jgi:hypothetical protein